jgi:hypothetical protein
MHLLFQILCFVFQMYSAVVTADFTFVFCWHLILWWAFIVSEFHFHIYKSYLILNAFSVISDPFILLFESGCAYLIFIIL